MSKAQTDIRTTSYDVLTANPDGYVGTIEDALAQIRAEEDVPPPPITSRWELLNFLGVFKPFTSGIQAPRSVQHVPRLFPEPEDDSVFYGASWDRFSPWSVEYAQARWPENFT